MSHLRNRLTTDPVTRHGRNAPCDTAGARSPLLVQSKPYSGERRRRKPKRDPGRYPFCGAKTREGAKYKHCHRPSGWGTENLYGVCKLHGGLSRMTHGRRSKQKTETLKTMIVSHMAAAVAHRMKETPDLLEIIGPEFARILHFLGYRRPRSKGGTRNDDDRPPRALPSRLKGMTMGDIITMEGLENGAMTMGDVMKMEKLGKGADK